MPFDARLRNELTRDASGVGADADIERFLDRVVARGRRRKRCRLALSVLAAILMITVGAVAWPTVVGGLRHQLNEPANPSPTQSPGAAADHLIGIWQSTTTQAQMRALARGRFPYAQTPQWRRTMEGLYQQNGLVGVNTVQFENGQLTVILSADGGTAQGEWSGTYAVVDDHTFVAGDNSSGFYITYHYRIDGNTLIVHVVTDLFPEDVGPDPPPVPDLVPQVLLWETAPFAKTG